MKNIEVQYSGETDSLIVRFGSVEGGSITEIEPGARLFFDPQGVLGAIEIENPAAKFGLITHLYQRLFAKRELVGFNTALSNLALNGLGILNYTSPDITGEKWLLTHINEWLPTPIIFDVGAHRGEFAKLAQELIPHAMVYAFEPHPVCFQELTCSVNTSRAILFNLGLSDKPGRATLYDYCDAEGSQEASLYREIFTELHQNHQPRSLSIELDTLDEVSKAHGIEHIDLLKIDVEGHELSVLQGAGRMLERNAIKIIQFEVNEMNVVSRVFVSDFMKLLPNHTFFRMLPDGLLPLSGSTPLKREVFGFQNLCALRGDVIKTFYGE